jgi:hypothetical protein
MAEKKREKKGMRPEIDDAVANYLDAVSADFASGEGENSIRWPLKKKIVRLFRKIPDREKTLHLYLILKRMSQPVDQERLTGWRRDLGLELVKELEKI